MGRRGNREGSIYKRKDNRWCGALVIGYDPRTGKPVRKYVYAQTRQEVLEKLSKLVRDLQNGLIVVTKQDYTFGQWLKTYLELYRKPQLRQTTYDRYVTVVNNHVPRELVEIPLSKLRSEHLQSLYLKMKEEGLTRSIEILHTLVNGALKQAVRLGYLSRNVAEATVLPKGWNKKEMRVLSEEELRRFMSIAREHRLYPAFLLLVSTGLRRGELLGLKWSDIDWERGTISIRRNLIELRGRVLLQEPKTRGSYRTIPLPESTLEVLRAWRKRWFEEKLTLGPDWPETDLVFPSEIHTTIHPRSFFRAFKTLLEQAGLPRDISIHSLRHTYATILLKEGEHPKVVQELLGHSSITTTLDVYSQVMPGLKERAQEKVAKMLNRLTSNKVKD